MMWQEFEELAGYEVTYEDYHDFIEPMYMALDVSKQEFVKFVSKERFALPTKRQLIRAMRKEAEIIKKACVHYSTIEEEEKLEQLIRTYLKCLYKREGEGFAQLEYGYIFGCAYPKALAIGYSVDSYEEIELIKEA